MSYTITYNGRTAEEIGLVVEHRPSIPSAKERITEFEIPGRDGKLHRREKTVEAVDIPIDFAFYTPDENQWMTKFREITAWLYGRSEMILSMSDDPGWYYKVGKVDISSNVERILWNGGRFTATFTVDGYAYAFAGETPVTMSSTSITLTNDYDESHPKIVIEGNDGLVTLTVNGKTFQVNVGQNVTIDTDLQIAYRTDNTIVNATVTGDYTDLWLPPGSTTISRQHSGGSKSYRIYPCWRKRL